MKSCMTPIAICVILISSSCNSSGIKEVERLDFNIDKTPDTTLLFKIEKIIKLQLTENSQIGRIRDIRHHDGRFFILDNVISRSLFAFDDRGMFISKTATGRGPGELLHPFCFDVDKTKNSILLYDQQLRSIMTLDMNLNILNSTKLDTIFIQSLRILDKDKVLVKHQIPTGKSIDGKPEYYLYSIYENDFSLASRLEITNFDQEVQSILNPTSIGKETLLIAPWDFTVYQLKNNQANPRYQIDFGDKVFSKSELLNTSIAERWALVNNGDRIGSLSIFNKTDHFIIATTSITRETITFIHSLKSRKTYRLDEFIANGIIPKCTIWSAMDSKTILATVNPEDLIKFMVINKLGHMMSVSSNDNTYIMIFTINE